MLSQGFILYAAIPLVLCSVVESLMLATLANRQAKDYLAWLTQPDQRVAGKVNMPSWSTRLLVHVYVDDDVRHWYAMLFESYMTLCSCMLCLRSSFLRAQCGGVIFAILTGLVMLAAEDMRDTKSATDLKLPVPAVKVVFVLYAPVRFMCAALFVAAVSLFSTRPNPQPNHESLVPIHHPRVLGAVVCLIAIASAAVGDALDTCPV